MARGKMRNMNDHTDIIACAIYRTRGIEVEDGAFNPLRKPRARTATIETMNHQTCPTMYYRGEE